jgi:hypothetical protein
LVTAWFLNSRTSEAESGVVEAPLVAEVSDAPVASAQAVSAPAAEAPAAVAESAAPQPEAVVAQESAAPPPRAIAESSLLPTAVAAGVETEAPPQRQAEVVEARSDSSASASMASMLAARRAQPAERAPAPAPRPVVEEQAEQVKAPAGPVVIAEVAATSSAPPLQEAPAPTPAPAPAGSSAANPFQLQPSERGAIQSQVRDKSLQIARLSSQLAQAAQSGDEGEVQRLLADLEIEAGGQSSYYLNMLAYVALTRDQYPEVEAILSVVLSRNPDDANAGLNMAVAESRTGRLKEARQRLERLALAHPEDSRIGALLASLGER